MSSIKVVVVISLQSLTRAQVITGSLWTGVLSLGATVDCVLLDRSPYLSWVLWGYQGIRESLKLPWGPGGQWFSDPFVMWETLRGAEVAWAELWNSWLLPPVPLLTPHFLLLLFPPIFYPPTSFSPEEIQLTKIVSGDNLSTCSPSWGYLHFNRYLEGTKEMFGTLLALWEPVV